MDDLLDAYKILHLEPGASPEAVKQAYRQAAWLWHPDRFPDEPYIQERAQKKIRDINIAYARLKAHFSGQEAEFPAADSAGEAACTGHGEPLADYAAPPLEQAASPARLWLQRHGARLALGVALLAGLLLSPLVFSYLSAPSRQAPAVVRGASPAPAPQASAEPFAAFKPAPPAAAPEKPAAPPAPMVKAPRPAPAAPRFFTLGSTRDEVRAVQGDPTASSGNTWKYALSSVTFKNGRVISYENISWNLRVRLHPRSAAYYRNPPVYFTVGSSKDRVLAVQGTPSGVVGNTWKFGESEVNFRGGRVAGYSNHAHNLQVRPPARHRIRSRAAVRSRPVYRPAYFTLGSSKRRVLAVQGSPNYVWGNTWWYGYSRIHFYHDRVIAFADYSQNLRIRMF